MATKWKKSKAVKLILVVMTVVLSFTLAFSAVQCVFVMNNTLYGSTADEFADLYHGGLPDFFDCPSFQHRVMSQIWQTEKLFDNPEAYLEKLQANSESTVR